MKIIKLFALVLMSVLFAQCDTESRRQSKAEDLIKKHLFETLDNFDSHEFISISVDTLKEVWMSDPNLLKLGDDYFQAYIRNAQIDSEIDQLQSSLKSIETSAYRSLASGNSNSFLLKSYDYGRTQEALNNKQEDGIEAYDEMANIGDSLIICGQNLKIDVPNWNVTYKFRCKESDGQSKIYTQHYIMNPKLSEIIFSWDDNDTRITNMIQAVNDVMKKEPGSWYE